MPCDALLTIELCGKLADLAGRELRIAIAPQGCTAEALLQLVATAAPALADLIVAGKVRVCVNEQIVHGDGAVMTGDVVALFPPVSGG